MWCIISYILLLKHVNPCFFILKALKDILQHFEFENRWFRFLMSWTGYNNYLFIRILSVETVSSERTIHTVSFRFLPLSKTESPLKSSNSSILAWDKATTELSSLAASSTIKRFGLSFFFKIAVDKSSVLKNLQKLEF